MGFGPETGHSQVPGICWGPVVRCLMADRTSGPDWLGLLLQLSFFFVFTSIFLFFFSLLLSFFMANS